MSPSWFQKCPGRVFCQSIVIWSVICSFILNFMLTNLICRPKNDAVVLITAGEISLFLILQDVVSLFSN
ncbi:hypothetical protein EDD18DRAFT_1160492 [Armillaria luteobubalina]|uniref:Uncharacterized protein n=1 Tax=Armillaria luteobubalina TaxID=153913 RepID=A0AA39QAN2_9AGAR|nr:hypothetical protein EDD18DRAFT_1160492 [Armillaria luteobubalina]